MTSQIQRLTDDSCPDFLDGIDMAEFPKFEYKMHEVRRAGEALRGDVIWNEDCRDDLIKIFMIANNWLDSHVLPMISIRHETMGKMRSLKLDGLTVSRLKRMRSIRKKLQRMSKMNLDQIQDLGGCRAIVPSMSDANKLRDCYLAKARHIFHNEKDYISRPKVGGYRGYHLVYRYQGENDAQIYNDRRIEIQIRTRLQHSWATAVEAVGVFRHEDLKAGEGSKDWLRLFDLMSAELALAENCTEADHLPCHPERVREIVALNEKLSALDTLESLRNAVKFTESYGTWSSDVPPKYYRIEFDYETGFVDVKPHWAPIEGLAEIHQAEQARLEDRRKINSVFVAGDKIDDLRLAFPNYFGDVQLFERNLRDIIRGRGAKEYTIPPLRVIPAPPHEAPDLSWFRYRGRWK